MRAGGLSTRGLVKRYGDKTVVRGLDIEVSPAVGPDQTEAGYRRWLTAVERSRAWPTD